MRVSMAYFAGAGTVIAAIGIGLGGGLTIANVMAPHQEKQEQSKLEQRMAAKPIPPSAQADQPKQQTEQATPAVPYVAATNATINANTAPAQPQPQTQAAAPAPQPSQPPAEKAANNQPAKPAEPQTAKAQPEPREQQVPPRDQAASSPEDANAKARDSDLKRLAAEKRKAERRQQWADRKNARLSRDAELRDVEESVRRASDGPRIVVRRDDDESDRLRDSDRRGDRGDRPFGLPGFNLFGGDRND